MRYSDEYDTDKNERDIYSSSGRNTSRESYEDISSTTPQYRAKQRQTYTSKNNKKKKRKKHTARNILISVICLLLVICVGFYGYAYKIINQAQRTPLDEGDLGIATDNYGKIRNIALFGIDSREDNNSGRSDAIVVLSVDKKNNKLKLTSIARDTYVSIDGHSKDKLTHAYAYGKSQLAVKTLNQNFDLEITDYVTFNFFGLARVIDYIGGVTVDVDEKERIELNKNIFPEMRALGVNCPNLETEGEQLLCGGQAVCYARIRHIDSDIARGNRQKEVLMAMYTKVRTMNPVKLPQVAEMVMSECETSLSTNDIISLGTWGLVASPKFEQLSIPNDNIPSSGKMIKGVWYYVYDLDTAKQEIHDFLFEENYYSAENAASRAAETSKG